MPSWQKLADVKKFEIELSSHCNARCPVCIRQITGTDKERPDFHKGHITVEQIKKLVEQLPEPKKVIFYFGGVGGDPMMNPDIVQIFKYCVERVKGVYMDTNGSLRAKAVWHELGEISKANENSSITFSIDGMEDTNHIYRIRTSWKKIMDNAKTFISAGGIAEWKYIVFKHNEHQVEKAEQLAKQMGFEKFIKEPSVRHYKKGDNLLVELDGIGDLVPEPATISKTEKIRHNASIGAVKIDCKVLKKKMMYITHDFKLLPCCYVHSWQIVDKKTKYFKDFKNNLDDVSLEDAMNDKFFDSKLMNSWKDCGPTACAFNCNQKQYWNKESKVEELQ